MVSDYKVVFYSAEDGYSQAMDYLAALPEKHEAKAKKWLELLQENGPDLPRPYADLVERELRELRVGIEHHQHRFMYAIKGKKIVVLSAFLKKTDAIPRQEIDRARRRLQDWTRREELQ